MPAATLVGFSPDKPPVQVYVPPVGVTDMLPLLKPQLGCVGVAVAVRAVEVLSVADAVALHPPEVTVTV